MTKRIAVIGAGGEVAYNFLFAIARGDLFDDEEVILKLMEKPQAIERLKGVVMELEDSHFPHIGKIELHTELEGVVYDADFIIALGKSRHVGMERRDLLKENLPLYLSLGQCLNAVGSPKSQVIVLGNPCNINAYIAMTHAPNMPRSHFHAFSFLDQKRAAFQLALKAQVSVTEVSHMTIWGNHSSRVVPDYVNARIRGRPAQEMINDTVWFEEVFTPLVASRGSDILTLRGHSSAGSAASALIQFIRHLETETPEGLWFSSGVSSDGNPYGLKEDMVFSFPCRQKRGEIEIVRDLHLNKSLKERIALSEREFLKDKEMALHFHIASCGP